MGNNGFNFRSRVFIVLWMVNFLLAFVVSLVSTPRPYLAQEFARGEDLQAATMEAYGTMLSLGFVAVTVGFLLGGFAADRLGKRRVVLVSFAILASGCGLFAVAPNLYLVFLASFIEMFSVGFSGPAISALVADCSQRCSRGMAYGVFNLSWVTAQIPAPLLGGFIAQYVSLRTPFAIAAIVGIVGMLFSVLMKGRSDENTQIIEKDDPAVEGSTSGRLMPFGRVVLIFSMTNLLNGLLNGFVNPLLSGILIFKLSADPTQYGLVLSLASSLVTGLVQIPGGKLADKFGRKPLVLLGFLGVPLVLVLGFSRSLLDFALIMGAISAVGNISSPAISAWLMDLVPQHRRASASGITQMLNGIGLSVGPTAGTYVWNSTKPDAALPCGIAALIFGISLPFYLMLKESKKG